MKYLNSIITIGALIFGSCLFSSCGSGENDTENVDLIPVKLSKDGNWSMINAKGEVVFDGEFKNRPSLSYNGFFSVSEEDGYSLYKNENGKPVTVKGLENLKAVGYMEDGLIPVVFKNSRITIVNGNGEKKFELGPASGVEVVRCAESFNEGMLYFKTDEDLYGYYNTSGEIAIKPTFKDAFSFSEGLAVVGRESKDSTSSELKYEVINKKGETVFKIKDGYNLQSYSFSEGYLVSKNDDRVVLIDKKGEFTKMPAKIKSVSFIKGKYMIFSNEDDEFGVADLKGEILIRPKYEALTFNGDDTFFAQKKGSDKEVICLDIKGVETRTLDLEFIMPFGKFGYIAKDGNTCSLLDKDFKQKGKEEFYDICLNKSISYFIESDYFNPAAVAKIVASYVEGDKVEGVKLGASPSVVLKGNNPSNYTYSTTCSLPDLKKEGFRYTISAEGLFDNSIADFEYNYYGPSSYVWNSNAKLCGIALHLKCQSDWGKEGQKELTAAFKSKGFAIVKEGDNSSHDALFSAMKKGTILVLFGSEKNGKEAFISIFQTTLQAELEQTLLAEIVSSNGENSKKSKEDEEEYMDIPVVEEVEEAMCDTVVAVD